MCKTGCAYEHNTFSTRTILNMMIVLARFSINLIYCHITSSGISWSVTTAPTKSWYNGKMNVTPERRNRYGSNGKNESRGLTLVSLEIGPDKLPAIGNWLRRFFSRIVSQNANWCLLAWKKSTVYFSCYIAKQIFYEY